MRGELLTAKLCLDIYMKQLLIILIENYTLLNHTNCNIWYGGRFIETWAESWIIEKLSIAYSKYNKQDMIDTLYVNMDLFSTLAKIITDKRSVSYPKDAEKKAYNVVSTLLERNDKAK